MWVFLEINLSLKSAILGKLVSFQVTPSQLEPYPGLWNGLKSKICTSKGQSLRGVGIHTERAVC